MASLLLTDDQITAGAATLVNGKLPASAVSDLLSISRGYLGALADDYPLEATFTAEDDSDGLERGRAAKLAACLALFQENQFTPKSGFEATNGSRTGFVYSLDGEVFQIFLYVFGLFWTVPTAIANGGSANRRRSTQGAFNRTGL